MAVKVRNLLMLIVAVNIQIVCSSNRVTDIDMSMNSDTETYQYSKEFLKALHSLELYIQHESDKLDGLDDDETDMQENDTIEDQKRPFVGGGTTRGYKLGKRKNQLYDENKQDKSIKSLLSEVNSFEKNIPRDEYQFADDSYNDFQIIQDVKRPFVLGNFKFGKRSSSQIHQENDDAMYFGESDYNTEEKRPFVFKGGFDKKNKRLIINSRQPFVLHGFDFVKPRANTGILSNDLKRPFVFTSGYNFGKRQQENDVFLEENKRPFVFSGRYKLQKNGILHDQSLNTISPKGRYEENSHIVKRPFVMGGYRRNGKQPSVIHQNFIGRHPLFIGSGFRFGKRGHWEGQEDGLPGNGIQLLRPNYQASLSGIEENIQKSPLVLDNSYPVDKIPFVIYGGYHSNIKRPLIFRSSLKQRDTPHPENRNKKRQHAMLFQGESQSFPLEIIPKEPFAKTPGKIFPDIPKRSFSFRYGYHFGKIRNEAKSDFRKLPYDQQMRPEKSFISNSPDDSLSFQPIKRPFTTSGNYKSRIGKRPFVLSGRRIGYKFG
ncbi:uncharacterized protein LOC127710777 [Mytilus californianus]|uniref:uncharacterized protein LOC127710777 n=1 Tax=Mytilus californianus TaxID=6549 RepID=UPI002247EB32|nr:uncharacterized protein LOC127710777 [Mytilus californianus]